MDLQNALSSAGVRDWETDTGGEILDVGVIGLGGFARKVALPAIESSRWCDAGAVISGSRAKAERIGAEYGALPLTYEEYREGDGADAFDAVYVVTPNATHLDFVETAADLGKDVLCEKPLEATLERATTLVETAGEAGVTLMTAYRMQATPVVRQLRDIVHAGTLGDVVRVEGVFDIAVLDGGEPDQWRLDASLAGGGALPDIGIYPLNTTRFVLGKEPEAVRAVTGQPHEGFEEVDEHVTFTLEFGDGVSATGHASFNAPPESRLHVVGTEATATIEPVFGAGATRTLRLETDEGEATVTVEGDEVAAEFDYFANAVLGDLDLEPDGADGLADMRLMDAMYESAETGRRIALDEG
ncbi:MAG: D-xylose 1-dehydrogenase Gfo6 [Halodesulfurarchaeum sp.]